MNSGQFKPNHKPEPITDNGLLINESFAQWLEETHNITYLNILKLQAQFLRDKGDECGCFSDGYCNNEKYPYMKCGAASKSRCVFNKF
jgi:hypothetical protein